ncbi:MAG: rod shape-determining protein RodA [Peptococcaceae bacterium]|jgi:rod shape determining protein RodA|nr:rod shape-determining protein RodA [Peptococcaceae bacterium]
MLERRTLRNADFILILVLLLLLGASLLILSTASINIEKSDPYHYVKVQGLWIATGLVLAFAAATVDYQYLRRFSWVIYGLNILLLVAVLIFGSEEKGATRWLLITDTQGIQPSEFAKVMVIVTLADFLSKREGKLNRYRDFILPFLFVLAPTLLIFKQPDLGTSIVVMAIFIGMMFVAGANPKKMATILLGGAAIVGVALYLHFATLPSWLQFAQGIPLPLQEYQLNRLTIFVDPTADMTGDGYHIIQSIWAIGSGGLWGKGYRMGTQSQLNFLPEHHTDFIFAVVGEEFGFIGTLTLLFLFFIFLSRIIKIAGNAKDTYGVLMTAGIAALFIVHILVNIGMTLGIMPVTGIPLPLISYGGSAMWAGLIAAGLVYNIHLRRQRMLF